VRTSGTSCVTSNRETRTICGTDLSRAARGKGSAPAFGASPSLRSPALHVLRTRSCPPFAPLGENVSALTGDDRFCNRLPPLRLLLVVDQVDFGFRRQVWSLPRRHRGRTTGFAPLLPFAAAPEIDRAGWKGGSDLCRRRCVSAEAAIRIQVKRVGPRMGNATKRRGKSGARRRCRPRRTPLRFPKGKPLIMAGPGHTSAHPASP
jgi:hypothetical protein